MRDFPHALPNLRHLSAVTAVMDRGSISAAAQSVHLTQPAVTQAVAAIEHRLGGRLFRRDATGTQITAAGEIARRRLERALEHIAVGCAEVGVSLAPGTTAVQCTTATQWRALSEVVAHGGWSRAARAIGRTRATLHRPCRELEQTLGIALMERTSHGVRPTRAAERLARRVRLAEAEWRQAQAEVAAADGRDSGRTVIGAMPLARSFIVPAAVITFTAVFPAHQIEILDGPYESLLEALRDGRADFLIGALRDAVMDEVIQEPLFDDPIAVVARAGHPLVIHQKASLDALRASAWIAPRNASPLRQTFDRVVGTGGRAAPIECNTLEAARSLLLASDRLMLASAHQVQRELEAGTLALVEHPFGSIRRAIGLTRRRDWTPTSAQQILLASLRTEAEQAAQSASVATVSSPSFSRNRLGDSPARRVKKREK
jgi:LysR family transcriptional regulator, regulator for genes of the gallate degradation pathway